MAEETFEKSDAGSSLTYPMQASSVRKGGYAILKGFPCKVMDMSTSKTGKHGHAKVNMTGVDIFTGKKYEELFGSTHNVDVPNVERADYQLIDITDDDPAFVSLLDQNGNTKDDLKLPEGELGQQLKAEFANGKSLVVAVQSAMGVQQIMSFKEDSKA